MSSGPPSGGERQGFRPSRPKVVQPKPTNKDAPTAAPTAPSGPNASSSNSANQRPAIQNAAASSSSSGPSSRPGGPKIIQGQGSGSTILVSNTQRGNPVVSCIKNVGWEYATIKADYQMGVSTCALFLSLKYHQVHPDYLDKRIESISGMFNLRILLLMCDAKQYTTDIKDLTKRCLANNITVVMAWTPEQAARWLEQYKQFENKGVESLKGKGQDDWQGQMTDVLTSVNKVNKTDALALITKFGSLRRITQATPEQLSSIPGFGEIKVKRLREAFTTPFRINENRTFRDRQAAREALEGPRRTFTASGVLRDESGDQETPDVATAMAQLHEPGTSTATPRREEAEQSNGQPRPPGTLNANDKRNAPTTTDMGPDLDFGADFDLTEEELNELQSSLGSESHHHPAAAPSERAEAIKTASNQAEPLQREVAKRIRTAHPAGDDDGQADAGEVADNDDEGDAVAGVDDDDDGMAGMNGLTEEERRELKEAMALSMAEDDGLNF